MKPMLFDGEGTDFQAGTAAPSFHFRKEVLDRMRGPGGYYNVGNFIGIATGVAVQLAQAPVEISTVSAIGNYFAGDLSGIMLTFATIVFMFSGEAYHRAWANGFPPDKSLNRLGDMTSGVGAAALAIGLLMLGQPILAATSGLLHAFGKFGSALYSPKLPSAFDWPWIFRAVVIESRVPAMLAAVLELARLAPAHCRRRSCDARGNSSGAFDLLSALDKGGSSASQIVIRRVNLQGAETMTIPKTGFSPSGEKVRY